MHVFLSAIMLHKIIYLLIIAEVQHTINGVMNFWNLNLVFSIFKFSCSVIVLLLQVRNLSLDMIISVNDFPVSLIDMMDFFVKFTLVMS